MSLTIKEITETSMARSRRWHDEADEDWSPLEWAGAMAGEAGEACNAAKKLKRIVQNMRNISSDPTRAITTMEQARDAILRETADTILYAVILAEKVGGDLEGAIKEVFNQKSIEYGFPERL